MQTVQTLNEGLKRSYALTISAKEIAARVDTRLKEVAPTIRMPGFRPGKVPANLVRKMHGSAIEQEALNAAVQEGVQSLLSGEQLRPAMQPAVELGEDYAPGRDAEVKVSLEVLPQVPAPQIDGLKLERLTVEAGEDAVDAQVTRLAGQQKAHESAPEGHPAIAGDLVVMDYVGKSDGVAFEGGTGEGMSVELGSGQLIPGFEEQLEGVKAGEERVLNLVFPKDYGAKNLAGKAATFEVKVTDVRVPKDAVPDDEFAKSLGLSGGLEQLRGLLKGQIEQELNGLTRTHMKRKLLDQLAENHDFDVPPSMVDAEFQQIWAQLEHEATHEADPEAAKAEMEGEREDYRRIAERRVRLGLLLSEIGQANGVEISQAEMNRLVAQAAQQYQPKDRERFAQWVQSDPMAAAQIRAPLYEDKVVDFLFSKADITDRTATREELEAEIEADEDIKPHVHGPDCGHDHDHHAHDHDHAPVEAKQAAPSAEEAPELAADQSAAKKPAAKKKPKAEELPVNSETALEAPAPDAAEAKPKRKAAAKKAPTDA